MDAMKKPRVPPYSCGMCDAVQATPEENVEHMLDAHGVTIEVDDLLHLMQKNKPVGWKGETVAVLGRRGMKPTQIAQLTGIDALTASAFLCRQRKREKES